MKRKTIILIIILSVISLVIAGSALWFFYLLTHVRDTSEPAMVFANIEPSVPIDTTNQEDYLTLLPIDTVIQRFQVASEHDYYKYLANIFTQRIFFIDDTTAVRMEIVNRGEWERLSGKSSLQEIKNMRRSDVVQTDSTVTLYPKEGEAVKFLSYDEMRPDEYDVDTGFRTTYDYMGYLPGADMWIVYGLHLESSTAGYGEAMYIDCRTGKILELKDDSNYFSPDGKFVFEYYRNGHDHEYWMGVTCVETGKTAMSWDLPESFEMELKCVEWVSDSVLKLRFFDGGFESEITPYINALGYRVVYLTPFRLVRPNENHYY